MLGEIFPLSVRGLGIGISGVVNWASNLLVALTFPMLFDKFGTFLFVIYAIVGIIAFIFVQHKVIETSRKSLEEIELDLRVKFGNL